MWHLVFRFRVMHGARVTVIARGRVMARGRATARVRVMARTSGLAGTRRITPALPCLVPLTAQNRVTPRSFVRLRSSALSLCYG